jgi:PTH1 family peptidyl-tRNA hydrolase
VNRLILGLGNPGEEYRATRHNVGFRVVEELARRRQARLDRLECNALTARFELAAAVAGAGPAAGLPLEAAGTPAPVVPGASPPVVLAGASPAVLGAGASAAAFGAGASAAAFGAGASAAAFGAGALTAAFGAGALTAPLAVLLAQPQTYMNRSGFAARCLAELHGFAPEQLLVVYDEINLPFGRLRLRRSGSPAGHRGIESILENLRTDQVPRLRVGIAGPGGPPDGEERVEFVLSPFTPAEEEALAPVLGRAADACEAWLRDGIDTAMGRFNGAPAG